MATIRRSALAPARPRAPRLGLRLGWILGLLALLLAGAGGLYYAARETSVFAVRAIDVTGSPAEVTEAASSVLGRFLGESLVAIDLGQVETLLRELPSVQSARVERDFPDTLRVRVRPERAVAVVRHADSAWLVAATGRIIRAVAPVSSPELPRVWLSPELEQPAPGRALVADDGGASVAALAALPRDFPASVRAARGTPGDVILRLGSGTELRLGGTGELRLKLRVAATVLESLGRAQRSALAYLDVSVPTRPVGGQKYEVERDS